MTTPFAAAALEACRVTVEVGGGRPILNEASLRLSPGALSVIIGPNGAGKSTLFKTLSGELKPTRGHVQLDGRQLSSFAPAELSARRAVVPQASHLSFPFSVEEVVLLGATVPGLTQASARQHEAASSALDSVGLGAFAERFYTQLSGGERQRVHLARALCQLECARRHDGAAPILLLDEPTASLDLMHQVKILTHVRAKAREGFVVLVVLHDLNLAAAFADQLVVMGGGRVLAHGSAQDVFTSSILSEVYGCPIRINETPGPMCPFVLPHPTIQAAASAG